MTSLGDIDRILLHALAAPHNKTIRSASCRPGSEERKSNYFARREGALDSCGQRDFKEHPHKGEQAKTFHKVLHADSPGATIAHLPGHPSIRGTSWRRCTCQACSAPSRLPRPCSRYELAIPSLKMRAPTSQTSQFESTSHSRGNFRHTATCARIVDARSIMVGPK